MSSRDTVQTDPGVWTPRRSLHRRILAVLLLLTLLPGAAALGISWLASSRSIRQSALQDAFDTVASGQAGKVVLRWAT